MVQPGSQQIMIEFVGLISLEMKNQKINLARVMRLPFFLLVLKRKKLISKQPSRGKAKKKLRIYTKFWSIFNLTKLIIQKFRHKRFMNRRFPPSKLPETHTVMIKEEFTIESKLGSEVDDVKKIVTSDKECNVNFLIESSSNEMTLVCNKFIFDGKCDAQIQTEIFVNIEKIKIPFNRKKLTGTECGTPVKEFKDAAIQFNLSVDIVEKKFSGISSVKDNDQLLDLAGVSFENFEFLLKAIEDTDHSVISKKNRLLIFLIKIKTSLTFLAISVLFSIHRTTVVRIFHSVLSQLVPYTQKIVFWPDKSLVQSTMPASFRPKYGSTRVIIDCVEFKVEVCLTHEQKDDYSDHKKGFTAKILIGITPGGFISFKSKVVGGRKSDSQLAIESGLMDLLEDGDTALADKNLFADDVIDMINKDSPEVKRIIDKGRKAIALLPPFMDETKENYKIPRVRLHSEKLMQRLRTFKILDKVPENSFNHLDDILHMCCVLVNLQYPMTKPKVPEEET